MELKKLQKRRIILKTIYIGFCGNAIMESVFFTNHFISQLPQPLG